MWKGENRKTKNVFKIVRAPLETRLRSECEEGSCEDKNGWKEEQKDSKQKDEKYFENCEKTAGNKVRAE